MFLFHFMDYLYATHPVCHICRAKATIKQEYILTISWHEALLKVSSYTQNTQYLNEEETLAAVYTCDEHIIDEFPYYVKEILNIPLNC